MKSLLLIAVVSILGLAAQAGTEVCAGKTLYFSNIRADLGIQPPQGYQIGSLTIVSNAKVLVNQKTIVGAKTSAAKFAVDMVDEQVISSEGNMWKGSSISKKTAILYKRNTADGSLEDEVSRDDVLCQKTWRMAM